MLSTNQPQAASRKELRSFGAILAVGFLVIAVWPAVFRSESPRGWAVAVGLTFATAGVFLPASLRIPHRVWMTVGNLLGWINSKVILGVVYFIIVTPVRFLLTLVGHDPMSRSFERSSVTYRVNRQARPASHMKRQF